MRTKSRFWYDLKVVLTPFGLLPLLALPAFSVLIGVLSGTMQNSAGSAEWAATWEVILPLSVGMFSAQLLTVEHEERVEELRHTYPYPAYRLPLSRTGIALCGLFIAVLLGWLFYQQIFGALTFSDFTGVVRITFPPTLFMLGLGLLAGSISRSSWVAMGFVLIYWFIEIILHGYLVGEVYLFLFTWPVDGISLGLNRFLLTSLGLVWIFIAIQSATLLPWRLRQRRTGH